MARSQWAERWLRSGPASQTGARRCCRRRRRSRLRRSCVRDGREGPDGSTVVVGSKNFTEQVILGEMVAQALEARGRHGRAKTESRRDVRLRQGACAAAISTSTSNTPAPPSRPFSTKRCRGIRSRRCTRARELYASVAAQCSRAARVQQHLHDPRARSRCTGARASDDRRSRAAYGRGGRRGSDTSFSSGRTAIRAWSPLMACASRPSRAGWSSR